ncbi:MAG TPA: cyclic nucleotide-binding/CBS domain-containing protein [Pseudomonas xinjiangensis]|uniref:Cyclic nucleotide-binding/CBS domain-containing protein n=2 Tax=root TaxID=1 RepID=A0A7V1FTS9_9GAMM|nr:cyclic nucleotide-binding/CBS domain-containing protein [Halopseudomonas xinjiangensis]HEC47906.1 cyclic nucleotide-binding/CBS domain-containing protein [Halopseudomonas xinjiangensis]
MQVELLEIRNHLARFPPFDTLDEDVLDGIASQIEISYFRAGTQILEFEEDISELHYVRSGAVEIYRRNGELYNRLTEGDIFGHFGLLRTRKVRFPAKAIEDSLIYLIPDAVFTRLCESHDDFADFVEAEGLSRLQTAVERQTKSNELSKIKVRKLISRLPVTTFSNATIQEAAQIMTSQSVSSLLIMDPNAPSYEPFSGPQPGMTGILTDRDFRTRMVAEGLPAQTLVSEVMSPNPITVQADDTVFEAMLCMLRNNIHHLPVLHRHRPIGVINLSDIIKYESQSSLYLVNSIFNKQSIAGLAALLPDVRATYLRMVQDEASAQMIGGAISSIGRNFSQRLLELAEQELGPPPVPYCFMALGSMARDEQLVVTDQDNALILDDSFVPEQHDDYFLQLATLVSDGLAACGYTYCKGGIMATNPKWRQPLRVWKNYFSQWIKQPNPETLLNACIFFDLDSVHGEASLVDSLRNLLVDEASRNEPFLASLARNALNRTPPLGFFRTFVMEKDGEQNNVINLKRRGTAPLTDLIRVHALACGSKAQNSYDRLDAIAATKLMPPEALVRLRYALEFLSIVRIRHQAADLEMGREPDNNIEPEKVPPAERHNLKEAFQVLSNAQKFLRYRYPSLQSSRTL